MRHYNVDLLDKWLSSFQAVILSTFRPFPGKYPTRILIRVYSSKPTQQAPYYTCRKVLFLYNGVPSRQAFQSYEAWKRRYCAKFSLQEFLLLQVNFMEYHQNGVIMAGNFSRVQVNSHHLRVHLVSLFSLHDLGMRAYQGRSLNSINLPSEKVVRCNGASFYVPENFDPNTVEARIRERQRLMRAY